MLEWTHIAGAAAVGLLALVVVFLRRCFCPRRRKNSADLSINRAESLQIGIAKLHHAGHNHHKFDLDRKRRANYYVFRREVSSKSLFSWADHPSLLADAVENGWSRFAFSGQCSSSPSTRSARAAALLGPCVVGDGGRDMEVESSWEICQGSADFMQKIRLNPGLKKIITSHYSSMAASSVIKTALPLPGPSLGSSSSFPQEAYFEITILSSSQEDDHYPAGNMKKMGKSKGEKTKLIEENPKDKESSESLVHVTGGHGNRIFEESKLGVEDGGEEEVVLLSIGLSRGGPVPVKKVPGRYPGSIGFNSNGSVYLDGIKLIFGSENEDWAKTERVIGCGYNPSQKKVFFTVDSEMVHVIHCKAEEFGTPLYPTLASNADVTVLINLGQSVFKYGPTNGHRNPNPCFIGPLVNSPALGYEEDSKELFSMGRIDAQWLNRCTTTWSGPSRGVDFGEESEADLFEIVLDKCGRSPNSVLQ